MIFESLLIIGFALLFDFKFGDPRNKYHPTFWIGSFLAKLIPIIKRENSLIEKFGGVCVIVIISGLVVVLLIILDAGISLITIEYVSLVISVIVGGLLLKSTIAIRGMEKHAKFVLESLDDEDLGTARNSLSMIVKRNTCNLDRNHILSGVLESVSENTVDGITGPLFYYAFFWIAWRICLSSDKHCRFNDWI